MAKLDKNYILGADIKYLAVARLSKLAVLQLSIISINLYQNHIECVGAKWLSKTNMPLL